MATKSICAALLLLAAIANAEPTPEFDIDPNRITVSGTSAGGAMANQLHIAFPEIFSGAAIVAGPPYGCADGSVGTAFARCMAQVPGELPVDDFADAILLAAEAGRIGDPQALGDDRVWLFHGSGDTVVAEEVSDGLARLYARFVPSENVVYVDDFPAAHHFPTLDQGHACDKSESPYIGACGYDAAGELLSHLYPGLDEPGGVALAEPAEVELPGAEEALFDTAAWLYVPASCAGDRRSCALHLALHGCNQSVTQVGTAFIEQAGYLRWAEANGIVVAFPQVLPSADNPLACWDWWGYTGPDYRWRNGPQMRVLAEWVEKLAAPAVASSD